MSLGRVALGIVVAVLVIAVAATAYDVAPGKTTTVIAPGTTQDVGVVSVSTRTITTMITQSPSSYEGDIEISVSLFVTNSSSSYLSYQAMNFGNETVSPVYFFVNGVGFNDYNLPSIDPGTAVEGRVDIPSSFNISVGKIYAVTMDVFTWPAGTPGSFVEVDNVIATNAPMASSSTTSSTSTSLNCTVSGPPGPLWVAVLQDNSTTPVSNANITVMGEDPYCPSSGSGTTSLLTDGKTFWYSIPEGDYLAYYITVAYLGHTYNATAQMSPLVEACATFYLPSGMANVTYPGYRTTCTY
jgi:hypothetical protein